MQISINLITNILTDCVWKQSVMCLYVCSGYITSNHILNTSYTEHSNKTCLSFCSISSKTFFLQHGSNCPLNFKGVFLWTADTSAKNITVTQLSARRCLAFYEE